MQKSFADLEYAAKRKTTRRERFLAELERITPWSELLAALAPFYPKGEGRGRPPIGLERMLRMYNRFGLKKVRYRGLAKNTAQLMTLFGLANLMIAKRRLLEFSAQGAS